MFSVFFFALFELKEKDSIESWGQHRERNIQIVAGN